MPTPHDLLARLDAIGGSLAETGHALALIGLGSVGLELDRIDAYSDLDFFAIVADGHKGRFIDDLGWLSRVCPVDYAFQNTADGYKLLFADGIFCEFAVFELGELARIPFAAGRIVWRRPEVPETIAVPSADAVRPPAPQSAEWHLGEALTNLYVGLGRYRRGEKLTAQRFIQHYAVDRVIALASALEPPQAGHIDPFSPERRIETRMPRLAAVLPDMVQGYERSPDSALAILAFLEAHFPVSPALARTIRALCY